MGGGGGGGGGGEGGGMKEAQWVCTLRPTGTRRCHVHVRCTLSATLDGCDV